MNILIRADSSSQIGTGHIMRDLVLAAQLRKQYPQSMVIFAVLDLAGNISQRIVEAGYSYLTLVDDTRETLRDIITFHQIDFLVIDHYGIDHEFEYWIKTQHQQLIILSVDDTYEPHQCDILLNANIYADDTRYRGLVPAHCELRCGTKFTLLRDEFIIERQLVREKNSIFVGIGGTDPDNVTQEVLQVLDNTLPMKINVVTSTANRNLDSLQQFVATHPNIHLHINTKKVARLMNQAYLAIVAPSVILNELVFLSIPFIAIQIANNQREMANYLTNKQEAFLKNFDVAVFRDVLMKKISDLELG